MIYRQAVFTISAHRLSHCPEDEGFEVAFAGRSNAGKSSALNVISQQRGLARTSKTPGRTQQINFFDLDEQHRLVDLPGYGYAKVPMSIKLHWQKTLAAYLEKRASLKGLILLMDSRHPLTEADQQMLHWCADVEMPVHILLTKADKMSKGKGNGVLQQVRQQLQDYPAELSVQLFSALKKTGLPEAYQVLDRWLNLKR